MKSCLKELVVFLLGISLFVPAVISVPVTKTRRHRNSKFMGFPPDDILQDALDGMEDPLADLANQNKNDKGIGTNATLPGTEIKQVNNDNMKHDFSIKTNGSNKTTWAPGQNEDIKITNATPGYFTYSAKPITENAVVIYGGSHYPYDNPDEYPQRYPNRTEEIKLFWNSLGEAVENVPFLPLQLNVPDMLSAMTAFFMNYMPFLNRFINQNHPRPQKVIKTKQKVNQPEYYETIDYNDPMNAIDRREYRVRPEKKDNKNRRKNKRNKGNKQKNGQSANAKTTKPFFQLPSFKRTTEKSVEDTKLWNAVGSDQKDIFRLKNMPFTRKRIRIADREIFNFKNSDISNSPIMILNVPQRPITHYKIIHQETQSPSSSSSSSDGKLQPIKDQLLSHLGTQITERSLPKQKRKLKNEKKTKKSERKRYGKSFEEDANEDKSNATVIVP